MAHDSDTVSLRITLRYRDMDEFVHRYADNLSAAGLFLRTKAPKPAGTKIKFELLLASGSRALRGEGVVVSIRTDDKPGMALRFSTLDDESQGVLDRVVSEHGNGSLAPTPLSGGLGASSTSERPKAKTPWRTSRSPQAGWTSIRPTPSEPASEPPSPSGTSRPESALPRRRAAGASTERPWASTTPVESVVNKRTDEPVRVRRRMDQVTRDLPIPGYEHKADSSPKAPPRPRPSVLPPLSGPGRSNGSTTIPIKIKRAPILGDAALTPPNYEAATPPADHDAAPEEVAGSAVGPDALPTEEMGPLSTASGDAAVDNPSAEEGSDEAEASPSVSAQLSEPSPRNGAAHPVVAIPESLLATEDPPPPEPSADPANNAGEASALSNGIAAPASPDDASHQEVAPGDDEAAAPTPSAEPFDSAGPFDSKDSGVAAQSPADDDVGEQTPAETTAATTAAASPQSPEPASPEPPANPIVETVVEESRRQDPPETEPALSAIDDTARGEDEEYPTDALTAMLSEDSSDAIADFGANDGPTLVGPLTGTDFGPTADEAFAKADESETAAEDGDGQRVDATTESPAEAGDAAAERFVDATTPHLVADDPAATNDDASDGANNDVSEPDAAADAPVDRSADAIPIAAAASDDRPVADPPSETVRATEPLTQDAISESMVTEIVAAIGFADPVATDAPAAARESKELLPTASTSSGAPIVDAQWPALEPAPASSEWPRQPPTSETGEIRTDEPNTDDVPTVPGPDAIDEEALAFLRSRVRARESAPPDTLPGFAAVPGAEIERSEVTHDTEDAAVESAAADSTEASESASAPATLPPSPSKWTAIKPGRASKSVPFDGAITEEVGAAIAAIAELDGSELATLAADQSPTEDAPQAASAPAAHPPPAPAEKVSSDPVPSSPMEPVSLTPDEVQTLDDAEDEEPILVLDQVVEDEPKTDEPERAAPASDFFGSPPTADVASPNPQVPLPAVVSALNAPLEPNDAEDERATQIGLVTPPPNLPKIEPVAPVAPVERLSDSGESTDEPSAVSMVEFVAPNDGRPTDDLAARFTPNRDVPLQELTDDDPFDVALGQALNEELFDAPQFDEPKDSSPDHRIVLPRGPAALSDDEGLIDLEASQIDPAAFDDVDDDFGLLDPRGPPAEDKLAAADLQPLWPAEADPDPNEPVPLVAVKKAGPGRPSDQPAEGAKLSTFGEELARLGEQLTGDPNASPSPAPFAAISEDELSGLGLHLKESAASPSASDRARPSPAVHRPDSSNGPAMYAEPPPLMPSDDDLRSEDHLRGHALVSSKALDIVVEGEVQPNPAVVDAMAASAEKPTLEVEEDGDPTLAFVAADPEAAAAFAPDEATAAAIAAAFAAGDNDAAAALGASLAPPERNLPAVRGEDAAPVQPDAHGYAASSLGSGPVDAQPFGPQARSSSDQDLPRTEPMPPLDPNASPNVRLAADDGQDINTPTRSSTKVTVTGVASDGSPIEPMVTSSRDVPPGPPKPVFRPAKEQQAVAADSLIRPLPSSVMAPNEVVEAGHTADPELGSADLVVPVRADDDEAHQPEAEAMPQVSRSAPPPPPAVPVAPTGPPLTGGAVPSVAEPALTDVMRVGSSTRAVIAIDIGGRWTKLGRYQGGEITLIAAGGQPLVPAVIAVRPDGEIVSGLEAHSIAQSAPDRAVSIRAVLRAIDEAALRTDRAPKAVKLIDDEVFIELGGHTIRFREALFHFLALLRAGVVEHLGTDPFQTIFTVPHDLTPEARRYLRAGCTEAKLDVVRFTTEPEALVQTYNLEEHSANDVLLVDLGATHLALTVLRREQGGFTVVCHRWFDDLSGHTFDETVAQLTLDELARQIGEDYRQDKVVRRRLIEASERARGDIRRSSTVDLRVLLPKPGGGEATEQTIRLGRAQVYTRVEPLVAEVCRHAQEILRDSSLDPRTVDVVAMAGSGGTFPPVIEGLTNLTNHEPLATMFPIQAFIAGGARVALLKARQARAMEPDTLQAAIGIELPGGRFRALAPTGSGLPMRLRRTYPTTRDNQTDLELNFYQGDGELVRSNTFIGAVALRDIPRGLRGELSIELDLHIDKDGVLTVSLSEAKSEAVNTMRVATQQTLEDRRESLMKEQPPLRRGPGTKPKKKSFLARLFGRS